MSRILVIFLLGFLTNQNLNAEPWLGNRFAQNCAGCHAPGRKNLKAMDRRCTLSCQGCHVNPNGGGMRSFYGVWNQNKWLRSYRLEQEKNTKSTAPVALQHYGKIPFDEKQVKAKSGIITRGYPLVQTVNPVVDEKHYDRSDHLEQIISKGHREFMYQLPVEDPYRQFDYSRVDGGGDIRWLYRSLMSESNSKKDDSAQNKQNFLMSIDAGIRYRPIHRNLHLVYEARILGNPAEGTRRSDVLSSAGTRSMYAMVDNLPFNTFVMTGFYRPLIGSPTADHNALGQRMLATTLIGNPRAQTLLFEATSVGFAPNVPFAIVHYISKKKTVGREISGDQTKGFAINGGLRFVTLGAAVNYTYWKTTDKNPNLGRTDTEIFSFGMSGRYDRYIVGLEFLSLTRNMVDRDYRRGGVITLDTQTKIWRENYAVFQLARGNRASDMTPGSSNQIKLGVRGFQTAGVETMLTYDIDQDTNHGEKNKSDANTRKTAYVTGQLHLFF